MPHVQVIVNFPFKTGIARDVAQNVFNFDAPGVDVTAELTAITGALADFYTEDVGGIDINSRMSPFIERGACFFRIVEVNTATGEWVGDPTDTGFTMTATTGSSLPLEVAAVVSWSANETASMPAARKRGRNYIGPLTTQTLTDTSEGRPTIISSFQELLLDRTKNLVDTLADVDIPMCVWSRADAVLRPILSGSVDNEFDTQRRRGVAATGRTFWTAGPPV